MRRQTSPAPPQQQQPPASSSSSSSAPAPLELPSTDHDDVIDAERAYDTARAAAAAAAAASSSPSSQAAAAAAAAAADADDRAFQLVWALVHSSWQSDARRGRELAAALQAKAAAAGGAGGGGERARELAYLEAVGAWKTGDSVAARKLLAAILAATPHSRQAGALKAAVDDQIVRDGLLGIGIGAAAVAAVGCVLAVAFGSARR